METYIEFLKNNDYLMCIIHKDGKITKVTNPTNVNKIIKIAKELGYKKITQPCIIKERANLIVRRYNMYYRSKKNNTLSVVLDNIHGNMIINKNKSNKNNGKKIVVGIIIAASIAIPTTNSIIDKHIENEQNINHENELVLEDEQEVKEEPKEELTTMVEEESFHYEFENRLDDEAYKNASRYDDLFEKYGKYYGIDKNLLKAIAAQESNGDHNSSLEEGSAVGLMQLEKSAILGETISAYNYETEKTDSITVDLDDLKDLDTNIKLAAMLFQNCLNYEDGNPILALQTYNYGVGNIYNMLEIYSNETNKPIEEIRHNKNDNEWLQYRKYISVGDNKYIEHVLSYLPNDYIDVKYKDKTITQRITNDYKQEKIKT